jgi:hypothetical protein
MGFVHVLGPETMLPLLAAIVLARAVPDTGLASASAGTLPSTAVAVPRIADAAVTIDGRLDEAVWARAAVLREFSQYLPNDNRPADDSTTVLVWYSPTAIYFGIRAYQDSASVRATLADRDNITGDDYIEILLDTFNDRRQALVFGVNPLGVQADGTLRDAARQTTTSTLAVVTGAYALDLSPDYVYESKGHLTSWGYEVEIDDHPSRTAGVAVRPMDQAVRRRPTAAAQSAGPVTRVLGRRDVGHGRRDRALHSRGVPGLGRHARGLSRDGWCARARARRTPPRRDPLPGTVAHRHGPARRRCHRR